MRWTILAPHPPSRPANAGAMFRQPGVTQHQVLVAEITHNWISSLWLPDWCRAMRTMQLDALAKKLPSNYHLPSVDDLWRDEPGLQYCLEKWWAENYTSRELQCIELLHVYRVLLISAPSWISTLVVPNPFFQLKQSEVCLRLLKIENPSVKDLPKIAWNFWFFYFFL